MTDICPVPTESYVPLRLRKWKSGTLTYAFPGLLILAFWLMWGDFSYVLVDNALGPTVQLLQKNHQISDFFYGCVASLSTVLFLFINPVISYKSDNLRSKWGRRIPFIMVATPIAALAFVGLAFSPQIGGVMDKLLGRISPGYDTCVLLCIAALIIPGGNAVGVIYSSFNNLVNDVVPQDLICRFFGAFRVISFIAMLLVSLFMLGMVEKHFTIVLLIFAAVYGVGILGMCFFVKEGKYPPPAPPPQTRGLSAFIQASKDYLQTCFGNPYYLWIYGILLINSIAFMPFFAYIIFFAKSVGVSMVMYGRMKAIQCAISLILAYPMGMLADRYHPVRCGIVGLIALIAVSFWAGFCINDWWTFCYICATFGVTKDCFYTLVSGSAFKLIPKSKFAQYNSGAGIIGALLGIALPPLMGGFLDWTGHTYRYIFLICAFFFVISLIIYIKVYFNMQKYGGLKNYVAPEQAK